MKRVSASQILNMIASKVGAGLSLDDSNNALLRLINESIVRTYLTHAKDGVVRSEIVTMESSTRALVLPCFLLRLLRITDLQGTNYTIHTNNGSIATINANVGDKVRVEYMGMPVEKDENGEDAVLVPYAWGEYIAWEVIVAWLMQPNGIQKTQDIMQFIQFAQAEKQKALINMNTPLSKTEIEQALNVRHSFKTMGPNRRP